MIKVSELTVCYGTEQALSDLSLDIDETAPVTIVGKSGCGKSSLIYALSSLIEKTSGDITYDGGMQADFRKKTSVLLQGYGSFPWKTVYANTVFVAMAKGMSKKAAAKAAEATLTALGIYDLQNKYPNQLSGGQRQRAAIACAIVAKPQLMFLDEPTAALDSFTKENIDDLLLDLYLTNQVSYIMVTHDIEEAVFLGKRIIVMKKAGVNRIFENPFFGDRLARNNLGFYEYCLTVRGSLS